MIFFQYSHFYLDFVVAWSFSSLTRGDGEAPSLPGGWRVLPAVAMIKYLLKMLLGIGSLACEWLLTNILRHCKSRTWRKNICFQVGCVQY